MKLKNIVSEKNSGFNFPVSGAEAPDRETAGRQFVLCKMQKENENYLEQGACIPVFFGTFIQQI